MATNDKYDRQLRLWGAQGQRALGETRVVSVGASSAGTETLKNLVLPGVGAFTVMDFADETAAASDGDSDNNNNNGNGRSSPSSVATTGKITDHDVSSNFFLTKQNATKAEGAYKHLKELNPDVSGSYRNINISSNVSSNKEGGFDTPGYWKRILEEEYLRGEEIETEAKESGAVDTAMEAESKQRPKNLLVVASDVVPSILEALADACWEAGHPLIVVTSYGLIGSVRLQLPKKGAVLLHPKPTFSPPDLRLVTSFPAFREFVDSVAGGDSLQQMDGQQHGHVPYPILLAKAIYNYHETKSKESTEEDNKSNNNKRILPKSFAEKQDFVNNYVKPMARDYNMQLNFQEAVSNAYLAYTEQDIGWMDSTTNISKESKLGQLKSALETFIREHPDHRPPLNGSVPDMTASTALYVRLQQLYRDQAEEDLKMMTKIIRKTQEQQERDGNGGGGVGGPLESVTDDDIANFCANVYSVGYTKARSLLEEYHGYPSSNDDDNSNSNIEELVDDWKMALMDPYDVPVHTPLLWYLGVRATQIFCHRKGRYPGCIIACSNGNNNQLEEDAALLSEILNDTVIPHYRLSDEALLLNNVDSICKELTRYGNAEIHTVASVVGGVASQEAVKIVTGQYIPLDNTYVYNGIASVNGVYKF